MNSHSGSASITRPVVRSIKKMAKDDTRGTLSTATRIVLGALAASLLLALVNDTFSLGWVGQHSRQVMVVLGVLVFAAPYKVGAFPPQVDAASEEAKSVQPNPGRQTSIAFGLWLLCAGSIPALVLGPRIYRGEPIQVTDWLITGVLLVLFARRWQQYRKPK